MTATLRPHELTTVAMREPGLIGRGFERLDADERGRSDLSGGPQCDGPRWSSRRQPGC
jgi:hypothetical protein